jgi:hypothetical protein
MPIALLRIFFDSTQLKKQGPSKSAEKGLKIIKLLTSPSHRQVFPRDQANLHLQHIDTDTGLIG